MKTILVLTDFSINSDYVGQYAVRMAQEIGANILLCNIYQVPAGEETADRNSWPLRACEENSINDLGAQLAQLKSRMEVEIPVNGFRPGIEQYSKEGLLSDTLNELAETRDILLGIISVHGANQVSDFFERDHAWDIIDNAGFPIMVIPYQARFKPFRFIAFATAINNTDINVLESITGLAKYSNAEILITNITGEEKEENKVKEFFKKVTSKINYPRIAYHNIVGSDVANGLKQLESQYDVDVLVMVHQKRSSFQRLFAGSVTKKMTGNPNRPLLIFPCAAVKETLTMF